MGTVREMLHIGVNIGSEVSIELSGPIFLDSDTQYTDKLLIIDGKFFLNFTLLGPILKGRRLQPTTWRPDLNVQSPHLYFSSLTIAVQHLSEEENELSQ